MSGNSTPHLQTIALTILLVLIACTPTAPQTEAASVPMTDSLGREVRLHAPAQRIVSLAASTTEILFAIGAGDRVVGRDEYSDYPPEALKVESIGSMYPHVNTEVVIALEPDLVLAAGINSLDDVTALSDLGLTIYATSFARTIEDIYGDIMAIGTLTGEEVAATRVVEDMKARVAVVTDATAALAERPVVFYEIDATDPARPWTAGPGSFIDLLILMAGGENAGAASDESYWQISLEELVNTDPQVVVLGSSTFGGQTPELVAERPGWKGISAVRNGSVHEFDDNLVSRPGPRILEGLESLARLIHPELFE